MQWLVILIMLSIMLGFLLLEDSGFDLKFHSYIFITEFFSNCAYKLVDDGFIKVK